MNKKEIYEHLASIYLDNSRKKKHKSRLFSPTKKFFPLSVILTLVLAVFFGVTTFNKSAPNRQIVLVIQPTSVKLNFNSGATKKEICTFDLNKMDLSKFDSLGFSLRKTKYSDVIFLRVELINAFQEKSEIYIKDLQSRWRDYRINFADFKNITDWTKISSLSFIIEEWNMTGERGVIYIDNVKVIKERG